MLSELARHVVFPEGIVSTGWPAVAIQLERLALPLDRWQRGWIEAILAKRADGKYACGIGGAVASIPRQSGKTHTIGALIFALCLAQPGMLVLWSAHRARTHNETFKSMDGTAQRSTVSPFIEDVRKGSGEQEITFTNGSRILFGAREHGFGRGFAKVDVVVLDEAQILTESAMEDMVPATNAADNGLVLLIGTPPRPRDPGIVFTMLRNGALSGDETDVLYVEFSADTDADLEDREQWAVANPSFPTRTSETAILRMRKLLGSDDSFRREALGIWGDTKVGSRLISVDQWKDAGTTDAPDGVRSLGVAFSGDGKRQGVGGAVKHADDDVHVELVGAHTGSTEAGLGSLVTWLTTDPERPARWRSFAQVVISGRSHAQVLHDRLLKAGVPSQVLHIASSAEYFTACATFLDGVVDGWLTHSAVEGQKVLDDSVSVCDKKARNQDGAWGWHPTTPEGDEVPLEAVSLAAWSARTTKRVAVDSARGGRSGGRSSGRRSSSGRVAGRR